jgi:hypothetical protein
MVVAAAQASNLTDAFSTIESSLFISSKPKNQHPVVQAKNNLIDVDLRSNIDYFGPLYVGSQFALNHMIFNTASSETVLIGQNSRNA